MKKILNKTIALYLTLMAAVTFGGAAVPSVYAEPASTTVAVNVAVQQHEKGAINWDKGAESDVTAIGIGLPPEGMGVRGRVLARRAAIVDAQRNLAEMMNGVQIDGDTLMENLVIASDVVRSKVSALVKGARIVDEGENPDGSYFVTMRIPMYGAENSVASAALPELRGNVAPEPLPQVAETQLTQQEVREVRSVAYTGVVVNADEMGLLPTFAPVIYDTNGRVVYGIKNLDYDYAISQGMVAYANNLEGAMEHSRVGANPLVLNAVGIRGGKNSTNNVNVVVSVEDGDRILLACENSNILQHAAVVFVK